jgi:hypothetical protein
MSHHHHDRHRKGEAPAHLFWTKKRIAIVAVIALAAMAAFVVLTACEKAPAPKGPTPVVPAAPDAAAAAKPAQQQAVGVPMPASGATAGADAQKIASAPPAAGQSQAGGYSVSGPDGDQTKIEVGGLVMPKPVTWVWTAPTMQFRALQYAVPALGVNSPAAELVFSVFPAGDGGPVDANLDRWANQFREGEAAAQSKRAEGAVGGLKVSTIESVGAYMGMGAAAPRPGYMQLGAIVQAPGRNVFIKIVGPQATVESNRKGFEEMIAGIRDASAK